MLYRRNLVPLLAAMLLFNIGGCDLGWKEKAEKEYAKGIVADKAGRCLEAENCYRNALANNPYHPSANKMLATLLETSLFKPAEAVYYYRRHLDLNPSSKSSKNLRQLIQIQEQLINGEMEEPCDAFRDLIAIAQSNSLDAFKSRLSPQFIIALRQQRMAENEFLESLTKRYANQEIRFTSRSIVHGKTFFALVYVTVNPNSYKAEKREIQFQLSVARTWEFAGHIPDPR